MTTTTTAPTWEQTKAYYSSEELLAAMALLELSFPLRREAEQYLSWREQPVYASDAWDARQVGTRVTDEPEFAYDEWLASVDRDGRGWSSSEWRLFRVVAALLDAERQMPLIGVFDGFGSWEADVWRILVTWGTGGNNRDVGGRLSLSR